AGWQDHGLPRGGPLAPAVHLDLERARQRHPHLLPVDDVHRRRRVRAELHPPGAEFGAALTGRRQAVHHARGGAGGALFALTDHVHGAYYVKSFYSWRVKRLYTTVSR